MFTYLEVYEETDHKNVNKRMWSRYQITFNIKYKYHRSNNARLGSTERIIFISIKMLNQL